LIYTGINLKGLPNKKFPFENRSYLGEFEAEFKKALGRESVAQEVLFDEKTEGRKSRDTVPFTITLKKQEFKIMSESYARAVTKK
jgi:hypothetical protein